MTESTHQSTTKFLVPIIGAVVLVSLFWMGGGFMGAGGMMGAGMFLWPILLFGGLAWFLVSFQNRADPRAPDTAMTELRDRYARGEISEEEFEQRRQKLRLQD